LCFYIRWPPEEVKPNVYLNQGVRSIFFALEADSSTSFPIDQLTHVLQREREKTLIKIEFDQERITAALKSTPCLKERVSKNQNILLGYCFHH
jgi:hypothetical protein